MPMRPLKTLINLEEALDRLLKTVEPIDRTETVSIDNAYGRVCAENVTAPFNVPPFRRAAMDGYAVKAASTFSASSENPVRLKCIGEIHAGEIGEFGITTETCVQIATGAAVPDSADAVIQFEVIERKGDYIEITSPVAPGTNISAEGVDIKKGDVVLKDGDILTPGRIGALAAINKGRISVYAVPSVAIIPTGNEVAPLGTELRKGQVYDINSHTTAALVRMHGGKATVFPIVPDEFNALERAVLDAARNSDIIVITGGSSAGERDLNVDVLEKHGKIIFHGVQIKPGKPTLFGLLNNGVPVLNLPGYPTSCLTNGYIFLIPAMRKLARLPIRPPFRIKARLAAKIVSRLGRHQIYPVKLEGDKAIPVFKESGAITSMAMADGYIEIPYNVDLVEEGEEVEVTLFG